MRRSCLFAHNSINRPRPYLSYHSRNSSNSSRLILSLLRVNRIHNNVWRRSPLHAHSTGHVTKTRELNGGRNKQYREPSNNTHYYVALRKEKGSWKWTEAGSPGVTVATDDSRWQSDQPTGDLDPRQACGEIWYPKTGLKGLNDILCILNFRITRGYICERYWRFVFNQS